MNDIRKNANIKIKNAIISAVLMIVGLVLMGYFVSPIASLAMFLFVWGNNIQVRTSTVDTIKKAMKLR